LNIKKKLVIFTDLDGTLLNDEYHYQEVAEIVQFLLSLGASIVFASSKTEQEIIFYRDKLNNKEPFIVENGSAIIIPDNFFGVDFEFSKKICGYSVIELGTPYEVIREKLCVVKRHTNAEIVGFGDMTVAEVSKDSGLPMHLARLAKKRAYSEPFKILSGNEQTVLTAIADQGLCYTKGGRYFHALGCCDKGKATETLKKLYLKDNSKVFTVGVGNSENDLSMLQKTDISFFIEETSEIRDVWKRIKQLAQRYCVS
jgi:mannosyl-3-phosphoglycerate phosphatase